MCVTLSPANLTNTIVYAHRMANGQHVMGYQNKASSPVQWGVPAFNAMILPIPAKGDMGQENAVDLRSDPDILKDYAKATSLSRGMKVRGAAAMLNSVSVFKTGSYEVVMAKQPRLIPSVVKELHPEIKVGEELMEAYGRWYRGWHVAVCFFSGTVEAEPIMFTYEPKFPNFLFAPTLDAHTGGVPASWAELDHTIVFGSGDNGNKVHRPHPTPSTLTPYFPSHVKGFKPPSRVLNGDYWFPIEHPTDNQWTENVVRRLPAGMTPS